MSLHPHAPYPIPEETQRVARAAFPRGNLYMQVADHLGPLYHDAQFTALFPRRGQPAEAPWRLALVTVLQFAEGLSDRQAADAVRSRIDWKYVLGLELSNAGFDHSVLAEFRARLVAGQAVDLLLELLLRRAEALGLLRGRDRAGSPQQLGGPGAGLAAGDRAASVVRAVWPSRGGRAVRDRGWRPPLA